MSKRNYNVFFNTHTISGIVISVALYVIFFAGAFAFFKDEIKIWQEGTPTSKTKRADIDFDTIFKELDEEYELTGRDLQINFGKESDEVSISLSASKDSLASKKAKTRDYFFKNFVSGKKKSYDESYNLGEFLYRLHFLDQIPYPLGRYLSGFVALFFLFAIVTGVIVHWRKIIPNFYSFNPKVVLKRVWTDAHTALGILGLPFQFMFAVSGAYFVLGILVLIPANFLYGGDQNKLMEDLRPDRKEYRWIAKSTKEVPSFNTYVNKTQDKWSHFHVNRAFIKNYGGENMKYIILGELETNKRFIGIGSVTYDTFSGKIDAVKDPNEMSYVEDSQFVFGRLHFANFGGYPIKAIYFILALVTCFVIITGVLIWIEARNKKSMSLKQRFYTAKVGHIYLAICLSMLPVTALAFLFVKFSSEMFASKQTALYYFYFGIWLVFILFYRFKRDNYFTNKNSLLLGAIFGFLVPIANGIVSGNWLFKTLANQQYEIASVDVLWLLLSASALFVYYKINPKVEMQSAFAKNPIDYKNIKTLKAEEKAKLLTNTITSTDNQPKSTSQTLLINKNHIPMRTKIVILWILIIFGYIFHHIYGLATVFFNESVVMEGATGETPMWAHQWRILMEGTAFLFAILTLTFSNKLFKLISFIWAIIVTLFNCYHVTEELIGHPSDLSKVFILLLTAVASVLLVVSLWKWKNTSAEKTE